MSNQTIASQDTPDPWLIPSPFHSPSSPLFYLTFTLGNRIEIWSSPSLESFHDPHVHRTIIWQPAPGSPWSADIWAPELHYISNTWYIYAAAAQPNQGNASHRTIVLRCTDQDPMSSSQSWIFEGPLQGLPTDQWSIDATVFTLDPPSQQGQQQDQNQQQRWYICYSGWPPADTSDTQQNLYLAHLVSPTTADSHSITLISQPTHPWERPDGGKRGINEGPTFLSLPTSSFKGIIFSAHGSWTSEYKLGLLAYTGTSTENACNPSLWRKRDTPLLVSDRSYGGPFGPGHASFVLAPDGQSVFCVYHATEREGEGWDNRKGRVVRLTPDLFRMDAGPMCCAYRICGAAATHGGGQSGGGVAGVTGQGVYPGQRVYGAQNESSDGGHHHHGGGGLGKYADRFESRVPAQYRGVFDKAKGFFK